MGEKRQDRDDFALIKRRRKADNIQRMDGQVASRKHDHHRDEHFRRFPARTELSHGGGIRLSVTQVVDLICFRRGEEMIRDLVGAPAFSEWKGGSWAMSNKFQ